MNRLRVQKFKLTPDVNNSNCSNDGNGDNANNNTSSNTNGLINKITKRYSTLSNKITRRNQSSRKSNSPQKTISGSYDMTGAHSDDHRPEIGAPVLISTTTLDCDRFEVSAERLRQIGGGVAASNTLMRPAPASMMQSSPPIHSSGPSSGSETEVFVDALSVTPRTDEQLEEVDERFELAFETPPSPPSPRNDPDIIANANNSTLTSSSSSPPKNDSSPESHNSSVDFRPHTNNHNNKSLMNYYEAAKAARAKSKLSKRQHSKSAQNLHRSELKVFLQKAPSMSLDMSLTTADFKDCRDLPKLPELYGASKLSLAPTDNEDNDANDADKENSSPSEGETPKGHSKSEPNTPMSPEAKIIGGQLTHQQHFKSIDSLEIHHHRHSKRRSVVMFNNSNTSINENSSKTSLNSHNSTIDDFNLKSVSCQSLNAQTLFVSIDELNEITRQINESEEFNQDIDLEYCTHRDNLKPSERRITLLKNKNTRLISFNNNKEKLKKGWSDVKHWLGEEGTKIKEVVQKQATMQRIASSRLNLSAPENRDVSGGSSVIMRNKNRSVSRERSIGAAEARSSTTVTLMSPQQNSALDLSCDNIVEERDEATDTVDDAESSFTQKGDADADADDVSPASKRARREGQNGFEELRRYIKQGGDFGKELVLILQERVEAETLYSKSLSKIATKLNKACRELPGSIAEAWRGVATEMEARSDVHKQLSTSFTDEIVKPLKTIVDSHHKTRKSIESNVDKAARALAEWRVSEGKSKKSSHTAARENEKLQDAMLDVRIQKSPSIAILHQGANKAIAEREIKTAEKDCAKLDNKRKKAEEAVKRADVEYYTLCLRAERARVDWEMAVLRGSSVLQNIENQRLVHMKNYVSNYTRLTANMNPVMEGIVSRLQPQADNCNVVKDMIVVKNIRRNSEGPSEQLLPDFYCEHTTLAMNRERRKHSLIKLLQLVKTDLERERRSRNGLKGLSQSLNNAENQNITDKLYHIRSMLTYLEGARFKLQSALLELDHKPRTSHPLAQHIQITRDRTGLQQSILKVPLWLKNNDKMSQPNVDDSLHEDYDCTSQSNISANMSCTDLSRDTLAKHFNRSKSSIDTFSGSTQISVATPSATIARTNLDDDPFYDRGQADGGSNQQDSDFDEFSSQDDDDELAPNSARKEHKANIEKSISITTTSATNGIANDCQQQIYQNTAEVLQQQQQQLQVANGVSNGNATVILSRCKALYSYTPKLYDELELNPGDIIEVHAKQDDGWWLGALNNQVGIFPATYVEEIA